MKLADRSNKTYGRACGIFVKKRRSDLSLGQPGRTASLLSIKTASPTVLLVSWDEVKCRPIFERGSSSPTPISDEDECDNDDVKPTIEPLQHNWNKGDCRKRRKTYGFQRRQIFFPEASNVAVDSQKVSTRKTSNPSGRSSPMVTAKMTACSTFASPSIMQGTVCDALDSNQKHINNRIEKYNAETITSSANESNQEDDKAIRKRKRLSRPKDIAISSDFEFNDYPTTTRQPSSTTSISVAKAFFDRLDTTQLQLDASRTPLVRSKRCGRTQKRVDLHNADLKGEYEVYSLASRQSGVTPIPLAEYARNRSRIFRRHEMFDGFLDEMHSPSDRKNRRYTK